MFTMLGIPNCDQVRKARRYLDKIGIAFQFKDIRTEQLSTEQWRQLIGQDDEGRLINTRSPSFRKTGFKPHQLDAETKLKILQAQPTAMKRPVLCRDTQLLACGFDEASYNLILKKPSS